MTIFDHLPSKPKWEKTMSTIAGSRFLSLLFRAVFAFEPLAPTAISYFLSRTLRTWKQEGLIDDYKTRTKRLGKFHYKIVLDIDLNKNQVHHFFAHELPKRSKTLGRWFNV